nr:thioesterase family protein [Micromonospora sp. DSM 115978]
MNRPVETPLPTLAAVVGVEPAAPNLAPQPAAETFAGSETFVGFSPRTGRRHMFGGQLVGQALAAASRTVDVPFHSLHSYFLYGGDTTTPVEYEVHRTRDSRSFATRRVVGYQHGRSILEVSASFTAARGGFEHADPAPLDVPAPETVTPLVDHM